MRDTHLSIQKYSLVAVGLAGQKARSRVGQVALGPAGFVDFVGYSDPILNRTS